MKFLSKVLISGILLFSISSPASAKMVKNLSVPVIGDVSSLKPGDGSDSKGGIVLEQKFVAKETARLQSSFKLLREKFDAKHEVSTNDLLYKIIFPKNKYAYCTFNDTFSQQPKIGKLWEAQSCFSDEDGDGLLDREFSAQKNPKIFPRLSINLLWSDELEFAPLSITKGGPDSSVGVDAKLILAKSSPQKVKFELHLRTAVGEFETHLIQSNKFPKGTSFPQEVEVFGAKINIKSLNNEQMEYEVLSGFSTTHAIGLSRYMSLNPIHYESKFNP